MLLACGRGLFVLLSRRKSAAQLIALGTAYCRASAMQTVHRVHGAISRV